MNLIDKIDVPLQISSHLTSPFDVQDSPWLSGALVTPDRESEFDEKRYLKETEMFEDALQREYKQLRKPGAQGLERHYWYNEKKLQITPRSHREGDSLLIDIRCFDEASGIISESKIEARPDGAGWSDGALWQVRDLLGTT